MIGPDRSLYWSKGGHRGRPEAFATDQRSGACRLRSSSGSNFLRHHASALRIGRSTDARQAHRDYLLSIKSDLPSIGPKFPRSMHVASLNGEERAGVQSLSECSMNRCGLIWFRGRAGSRPGQPLKAIKHTGRAG
jgi:hypothetical protein